MEPLEPPKKWYHGHLAVFSALALLGPLAFPLLWKSPRFNLFWKIFWTVFVTAGTVWMIQASAGIVVLLMNQIKEMKEQGLL